MHLPVHRTYLLSFLFLLISMLLLVRTFGLYTITNLILQDTEVSLYEEANYISEEYAFDISALSNPDSAAVSQLRSRFQSLHIMTETRFWLTNHSGTILIDSANSHNNLEGININNYDRNLLEQTTFRGHIPHNLMPEEIFSVVYPLSDGLQTNAYLILLYPMNKIHAKAQENIDAVTYCFLVFFVLLLLVFLCLYQQTRRPLRQMTELVRQYSNEQFDVPIPPHLPQEYGQLASAIDYLAQKIKNARETQKKFVSNVSHDFRSPLTSIKGYTEAMLDGTIPRELQEKYLNIILYETNRLSKLTASLLELSQLENNGILLSPSSFDVNQVIKNTTSAFEQRCIEKKLSIQLIFTQKTLAVTADRDKVELVIQNLVDNAIKFSPSGSTIQIQTITRGGKAFISVRDNGIGIPKESLSKIWERFYKTDASRGRDKTGTGLGLSITKEIIEAHHEHINVVSTEGAGTEFTFSLKADIT